MTGTGVTPTPAGTQAPELENPVRLPRVRRSPARFLPGFGALGHAHGHAWARVSIPFPEATGNGHGGGPAPEATPKPGGKSDFGVKPGGNGCLVSPSIKRFSTQGNAIGRPAWKSLEARSKEEGKDLG